MKNPIFWTTLLVSALAGHAAETAADLPVPTPQQGVNRPVPKIAYRQGVGEAD